MFSLRYRRRGDEVWQRTDAHFTVSADAIKFIHVLYVLGRNPVDWGVYSHDVKTFTEYFIEKSPEMLAYKLKYSNVWQWVDDVGVDNMSLIMNDAIIGYYSHTLGRYP